MPGNIFDKQPSPFRALLANLNVRAEIHGDERRPACDLKFEAHMPNSLLDALGHGLTKALYAYDAKRADLADEGKRGESGVAYLPHRRFPDLGPLTFDVEMEDVTMAISPPGAATEALRLAGGKVNAITVVLLDGGTVQVRFRFQCYPDEHAFGELATLVQTEVDATVLSDFDEERGGDEH